MKTKFYPVLLFFLLVNYLIFLSGQSVAQSCSAITTNYSTSESRCAATGEVRIIATGGSGNLMYRVLGPVNTNFSTNSTITGLPAGRYLVVIKDVITGCIYQNDSVTVAGNYKDPRFLMSKTDVTCINGADGTITVYNQEFGRSPLTYTIVAPSASNVGLQNSTGAFTGLLYGNYMVRLTDSCGGIQNRSMTIANYDWWINSFSVNRLCDSAVININLKDSKGNTSPNAIFNQFMYGVVQAPGDTVWYNNSPFTYLLANKRSLKLVAKDKCGNVKWVNWIENNKPSVNANVTISNMACSTFTATITGAVNLNNPKYCLYNFKNFLIGCNSTGVFTDVAYGSYCIKITDVCYDTTINRCFIVNRPVPSVNATINISNKNCTDFTASVTGSTNLNNPTFCLYDKNNVLMYCNTTGVFNNLPYGNYCIKITNDPACYDTTITRCFTVTKPIPSININVNISNLSCSTFTASIQDTSNWVGPKFCLYDVNHVIIICNSTGVFNNLLYGTYCITVTNDPACYDTTIERCFTVKRPVPSVNATVTISSKTCTTFTAEIKGQQNINNAQYCLFDVNNIQLSCNTSGKFTNLAYGSYCIKTTNNPTCYDTVIVRCFTVAPTPLQFSLNAAKSCNLFGGTDVTINISSGSPAYNVKVYNSDSIQVAAVTSSLGSITIYGLPALVAPGKYKIVVTDLCNNKDSLFVTPILSELTKKIMINKKCPSGINPNGTADIDITVTTNLGAVVPKIIKKNNIAFTANYNFNSGSLFSFYELPPAVYIVEYSFSGCSTKAYDTVNVGSYTYPDLSQSSAYHCDNNTISVGAASSGGIAPFMYEIFQSVPALPSIISPLQSNPLFSFNNSTNYSLIRLRAIDACGNASINDVSILPLAPVTIIPPAGIYCINQAITLRVDTIANATYKWYHKTGPLDSVLVSSTYSYFIPVLFPEDTGDYVCVVAVNNDCLKQTAHYHVGGNCGSILPVDFTLHGYADNEDKGNLNWKVDNETGIKQYIVEKNSGSNVGYVAVAKFTAGINSYVFKDDVAVEGIANYRLKVIKNTGVMQYTNVVTIKNKRSNHGEIQVYPNPVQQTLNILFATGTKSNYSIEIINTTGKRVYQKNIQQIQKECISIPRDNNALAKGFYIVVITDLKTGVQTNFKMAFQ